MPTGAASERTRLAAIPANLITGRPGPARRELMAYLLSGRPAGERWAVLVDEVAAGVPAPDYGADVMVGMVRGGCMCCSGNVGTRTALTRLLRKARPRRLLVQASVHAGTAELLKLLSDRWLAPVLALRATVAVAYAPDYGAEGVVADPAECERFAGADLITIDGCANMRPAAVAALQRTLAGLALHARMVRSDAGALDLALLDAPARTARPRFASGEA